jgi:hypothetical protein
VFSILVLVLSVDNCFLVPVWTPEFTLFGSKTPVSILVKIDRAHFMKTSCTPSPVNAEVSRKSKSNHCKFQI